MPKITYIEHAGTVHEIDVPVGRTVMEGGRDAGVVGIVAECGRGCSCSTCHVFIEPEWTRRLPPIQPMEEDMLEFAPGSMVGVSRLGCQIRVTPELDGLILRVPAEQA